MAELLALVIAEELRLATCLRALDAWRTFVFALSRLVA